MENRFGLNWLALVFFTVLFASSAPSSAGALEGASGNELSRRLDVLAQEVQNLKLGSATEANADQSQYGLGPAASKVYRVKSGISLGGYGEIQYERLLGGIAPDGTIEAGRRLSPASGWNDSDGQARFDLRRLVLYVGYKFNDDWILNSELEWEHAGGEISSEFLYFDHFTKSGVNWRFGKILMPMGFTNEIHEPVTYPSVHRPLVETLILPSTWSEYGAGIFGDAGAWTYRSYLVGGMNGGGFSALEGIREGRNETGSATGTRFAWVGRADYSVSPGLLTGGSLYLGDASAPPVSGFARVSVPMKMLEAHVHWMHGPWDVRALGAVNFLEGVDRLNALPLQAGDLPLTGAQSVGSRQGGAYFQASYDTGFLQPYLRHEVLNTQMAVPAGYSKDDLSLIHLTALGLSFKPVAQLVFKADYEWYALAGNAGVDQVNLSMGYVF